MDINHWNELLNYFFKIMGFSCVLRGYMQNYKKTVKACFLCDICPISYFQVYFMDFNVLVWKYWKPFIYQLFRRFVVMCFVFPDMSCFRTFDGKMHEVDKILWIDLFYHNYANFICFRVLKAKPAGNTKNDVLCDCWPNRGAYEGVLNMLTFS